MKLFTLRILTPEKIFFEGEVQRVTVRTTGGDLGVLAMHENYAAALPSGPVRITKEDGTVMLAALSGGMIKISAEQTAILANAAEWASDIDVDWAKRSLEDAQSRKQSSSSLAEQQRADAKLHRALNRLKVSSMEKGT
ncbi:MAG: ATP synthase F1 subunit epsilon [Oscillospiraceae bacterium]|nr:ATP synthase F1 subunit epsilon [Oscillospiraceae bacterium]